MWSNTEAIEEFSGFLQSTSGQQCGTNYNLTVYNSLWKSDLEKQQLKDSTTMSDQIYRALEKTHVWDNLTFKLFRIYWSGIWQIFTDGEYIYHYVL